MVEPLPQTEFVTAANAKESAIRLWSEDPCGPKVSEYEPGTAGYIRRVIGGRRAYAPWMATELGYESTQGLRVLDVGCGQGIDLVEYASAGAQVTGIDLTPRHVELAKLHLAALDLDGAVLRADAESLPFPDDSFDRVSSNGVLHHTPDMPAALREIHRVLSPGGMAVVIVYNRHSLHYWLDQFFLAGVIRGQLLRRGSMRGILSTGVEYSSIGAGALVEVYTKRELKQMMETAGFTDVTVVVRHFRLVDTFVTAPLSLPGLRSLNTSRLQRYLGSRAGWYLVARGKRRIDDHRGSTDRLGRSVSH